MDSVIFPDQIHLEQIKKRLWCGREFGQAAVMIGTGFSKNAEKTSYKAPSFPLWQQLADGMYDQLYPSSSDSTYDKLRATSGGGALKLALEYETIFGRSALDNYLLESIDDSSYHPGELHKRLLSLPWSDIFTTNYDTLLERTGKYICERKYDLVETFSDMPGKMKPRIVKLHGSFPSHRPFIITEEDFRTYPKKFAPFVNMVQQSMMENAFCLLGFSGDDPNFLCWSGWVRDNLGESKPPIYLCGLLELELLPSRRKLLESKGIIPIDLSPKFPKSEFPDSEVRHKEAIKWFLEELERGKPSNPFEWPNKSEKYCIYSASNFQVSILKELYEVWKKERESYPGWIVTPKKNRNKVWFCTESWIHIIFNKIETLPEPDNLLLLYELNWRLERTLTPLFDNWAKKIKDTVEKFNPFPMHVEMENALITADKDEYKSYNWNKIGECWVELAFSLVREARENNNKENFSLWMNRLESLLETRREWKERWFYEKCLFYLSTFDREEVENCLENWPKTDCLSFWEVKRASILAEIGQLGEAEEIAEKALQKIRSQIQPYDIDCSMLSQEGWTMFLLKHLKVNKWISTDFYRDRWDKLENYRCNPYSLIELFTLKVKEQTTIPSSGRETTNSFDMKRETRTYRHSSGSKQFAAILPPFSFLRMFEEAALPFRCGSVRMYSDSVINSSIKIASSAPFWSLSSMVRTGNEEGIKKWFDRVRVSVLSPEEVDLFYDMFYESLTQSIKSLKNAPQKFNNNNYSVLQIRIATEILSRLSIRLSFNQLDQLFSLGINLYKEPIFRNNFSLHDCVNRIFRMLLYSMPQSQILEKIPDLLSLPIPGENGFTVENPQRWDEPLSFIEWIENTELGGNDNRFLWTESIERLIAIVEHGENESRYRAILRLSKLNEISALDDKETESFGNALWRRIDPKTGLPGDTQLLNNSYLFLPEPEEGIAKRNFHKYLVSKDFPRVIQRFKRPDGKEVRQFSLGPDIELPSKYIQEWIRSTKSQFTWDEETNKKLEDWTTEEIIHLVDSSIKWWDEEKNELCEVDDFPFSCRCDTLREEFMYLIRLISKVIMPRLGSADGEVKNHTKRLLSEMEEYGICVLSTIPMTLFIEPERYDEISQKMRFALNSTDEQEIHEAIYGIFAWISLGRACKILSPPEDLLDELVNRLIARRQPGLDSVIDSVSGVVRRSPQLINEKQFKSIIIALQYLIKETELSYERSINELSSIIPVNDLPEYRRISAELAYWTYKKLIDEGKEIPKILINWKQVSMEDPSPAVRKVWVE
jgi:hypothetical protein